MRRLATLLALALPAGSAARGQSVRGMVVEIPGNRPIPDAQVVLWSDSTNAVATTRTDSTGTFLVRAPKVGTYFINVRKFGYMGGQTNTLPLVDVQEYEIVIRTPRIAPIMPGVRITARGTRPGDEMLQGFDERRRAGFGFFMTAEDIDKRNSPMIAELLRGVSGVDVAPGPNGRYLITSTRGGRSLQNGACMMDLFLDGWPIDEEALQRTVRPMDLEAVEVYSGPATVPTQFKKNLTGSCGAVLFWSRIRNRDARKKSP
ncbi:MAG: carboxypeptidase regulatory-like domain-containing protein [Gemmatimonadetes bacterium]|nr:carboxypeptidase regulatory-like domain-containing protein [Gemmatimonadota bacterium]